MPKIKITTFTVHEKFIFLTHVIILALVSMKSIYKESNQFVDKELDVLKLDSDSPDAFNSIRDFNSFWACVQGPIKKIIIRFARVERQQILGSMQLRQIKVRQVSCSDKNGYIQNPRECYDKFTWETEDQSQFGPHRDHNTYTAWTYQTESMSRLLSYSSNQYSYTGGGYIQVVSGNEKQITNLIEYLKKRRWLNLATRVVFVDFTVSHTETNILFILKLVTEFHDTGRVINSWNVHQFPLKPLKDFNQFASLIFDVFFLAYSIACAALEFMTIRKKRLSYFRELVHILNWLIILASVNGMLFKLLRTYEVIRVFKLPIDNIIYSNFDRLIYFENVSKNFMAFAIFFTLVKISHLSSSTMMIPTVKRALPMLVVSVLIFLIAVVAFGTVTHLTFGRYTEEFSGFAKSFSLFVGCWQLLQIEEGTQMTELVVSMMYISIVFYFLSEMIVKLSVTIMMVTNIEVCKSNDPNAMSKMAKSNFADTPMGALLY